MNDATVHRFRELNLQDVDEAAGARENPINTRASRSASAPPGPSSSLPGFITEGISKGVCIVCREKFRSNDVLRAPCGHFHCQECFHRRAEMSTRDESLFPPSCCKQEVPLSSGSKFLEKELLELLKSKAKEYETADRVYCNDGFCSTFIPSEQIKHGVAACPRCNKETCAMCKGPQHINADCPEDPAEKELEALAKAEKWARCPNCKRRVERETGCNHMTCLCGTEFCYKCSNIWKTCPCPQYDMVAEELLEPPAIQVPVRRRRQHPCNHHFRFNRIEGRHACAFCHERTWVFIYECPRCHVHACAACRDMLYHVQR